MTTHSEPDCDVASEINLFQTLGQTPSINWLDNPNPTRLTVV